MEMKQGHLYRRRDGKVFLQEGESRVGSDGVERDGNGRSVGMPMTLDAVADLGPPPTWKQVVEMREECERLRAEVADLRDARLRTSALGAEVTACGLKRVRELEAEVADLRATLAKDADAPDLRTFADAPLHVAVADAARPLAVGDVVVCVDGSRSGGVFQTGYMRRVELCWRDDDGDVYLDFEKEGKGWDISRFRRATPAEVAEFERRERETAKPSTHVDLADRKIPPIPVGWRLVTDHAETPHPEAKACYGDGDLWEPRSGRPTEKYSKRCPYIVPIVFDVKNPWHGGPCPVAEETEVVVTLNSGTKGLEIAGRLRWSNRENGGDVVAYTVPSPKPAEPDLAAVALDPTTVVFATRGMEVGRA